jgi:hypothetical protein
VKNKVKIAIAAGAVLAGALAAAPVRAHAAAPALVGSCSETFVCAWGTNGVLFWSTNARHIDFAIDENVSYVENLTGYVMNLDLLEGGGYGWASIPPHTGLTNLGAFVHNGTNNTYVSEIELG